MNILKMQIIKIKYQKRVYKKQMLWYYKAIKRRETNTDKGNLFLTDEKKKLVEFDSWNVEDSPMA